MALSDGVKYISILGDFASCDEPGSLRFVLKQEEYGQSIMMKRLGLVPSNILYVEYGFLLESNALIQFDQAFLFGLLKHKELQREIEFRRWSKEPIANDDVWIPQAEFFQSIRLKAGKSLRTFHNNSLQSFRDAALTIAPPQRTQTVFSDTMFTEHLFHLNGHFDFISHVILSTTEVQPIPHPIDACVATTTTTTTTENQEFSTEDHLASVWLAALDWVLLYLRSVNPVLEKIFEELPAPSAWDIALRYGEKEGEKYMRVRRVR